MNAMQVKNMTEFRKSMKETLDQVTDNDETIVISRPKDKDVVMISIKQYNSINETLYLMSSQANHHRLSDAITDIENAKNILQKNSILWLWSHGTSPHGKTIYIGKNTINKYSKN